MPRNRETLSTRLGVTFSEVISPGSVIRSKPPFSATTPQHEPPLLSLVEAGGFSHAPAPTHSQLPPNSAQAMWNKVMSNLQQELWKDHFWGVQIGPDTITYYFALPRTNKAQFFCAMQSFKS